MELLAGCGSSRERKLSMTGDKAWKNLVTLDFNSDHSPDVVHDLTVLPYPFEDNTFDELHFYDVLEHLGQQGDFRTFFAQFSEFWRILKPDGYLFGISPGPNSAWVFGDPGHNRVMGQECLAFLDQTEYARQVGITPMTDYRFCYKADFSIVSSSIDGPTQQHLYAIQAKKPARAKEGSI